MVNLYRRRDQLLAIPTRRGVQEVEPVFVIGISFPAFVAAASSALSVTRRTGGPLVPSSGPPGAWTAVGAKSNRDFLRDTSMARIATDPDGTWVAEEWVRDGAGFKMSNEHPYGTFEGAVAHVFKYLTGGLADGGKG